MHRPLFNLILTVLFLGQAISIFAQQPEDPYLWLENIDDAESMEWVTSKNTLTENALKSNPLFEPIYEKNLEILNSAERIASPSIRGNYLYNFWQDGQNEKGLFRRTTLEEYKKDKPSWETILDIDALNKLENENWVYKGATWLCPDYKRCILRLSRGGGDAVVMREFDAVKKEFLADGFYLPEAKGNVSWLDENTLFVSTNFGEGSLTTSGYPRVTKLWKRGTKLEEAKTIFEGDTSDVTAGSYALLTPERTYQIIYRSMTFYTSKQFVIENQKIIPLDIPEDADFSGIFKNQVLIQLKSDWKPGETNYKQGAFLSIDYNELLSGSKNFTVVAEPDERSSIESISSTKNIVLINLLNNVQSELYAYHFKENKWLKEKVNAPEFGSITISSADDNSDLYFFKYNSFLTPPSLYLVSQAGSKVEKIKSLTDFFDATRFEIKQYFATSTDGTQIPYFLVHSKNMALNSDNSTLLYGYGGFEISMDPHYSATLGTAWLDRGGVYALANIRGGGEFGPKWHQAGLKENRQKVFDDFTAVAEDLIKRKITSPQHLGIEGGSNGGLLVGVAFTQRPDLYNAVVCAVPLLDMKRYNKLLAGASWMGEYGNPDIPEEWAYIKKYSPYQNVFPDKKYPKIFLTTTTRDDRVHPGHARKMAARMEEQGHKVYYFENIEGGHGSGTTNKQRAYRSALIFTYLLEQLR